MKRSTACLSLLFILFLLISAGCNKPAVGNNGAANANSSNTSQTKKVYQDMPPVVMAAKMKGLDGKEFTLKDYEGKVVLLNLWAIYCTPCRAEMPELVKLQEDYKDKNVVVIGLDIQGTEEDSPAAVKALTEKMGITYKIGWADEEVTNALVSMTKISAIPQSFAITPDGKLAGVFKGYNPSRTSTDVRNKIEEILNRPSE